MIQLLSGIQIDGETAKKYCAKSTADKVAFLVKFSKVDEKTAQAFVEKPLIHMDGKACCGGHKHQTNVANTILKETASPDTIGESETVRNANDVKGRGAANKKNQGK